MREGHVYVGGNNYYLPFFCLHKCIIILFFLKKYMAKKTSTKTNTSGKTKTVKAVKQAQPVVEEQSNQSETIDITKISLTDLYSFEKMSKNICSIYEQAAKLDEYDNMRYNRQFISENINNFNRYVLCHKKIISEIERRLKCI